MFTPQASSPGTAGCDRGMALGFRVSRAQKLRRCFCCSVLACVPLVVDRRIAQALNFTSAGSSPRNRVPAGLCREERAGRWGTDDASALVNGDAPRKPLKIIDHLSSAFSILSFCVHTKVINSSEKKNLSKTDILGKCMMFIQGPP